eukprot:Clim_evm9s48 gene=Clim_evmTU9s48
MTAAPGGTSSLFGDTVHGVTDDPFAQISHESVVHQTERTLGQDLLASCLWPQAKFATSISESQRNSLNRTRTSRDGEIQLEQVNAPRLSIPTSKLVDTGALRDSTSEFLTMVFGEQFMQRHRRQQPSADQQPPNFNGLASLIKAHSWRQVVILSSRILNDFYATHSQPVSFNQTIDGQQSPGLNTAEEAKVTSYHPLSVMQIWVVRVEALRRLGQSALAIDELETFEHLCAADLSLHYVVCSADGSQSVGASTVPFSLRLLLASCYADIGAAEKAVAELGAVALQCTSLVEELEGISHSSTQPDYGMSSNATVPEVLKPLNDLSNIPEIIGRNKGRTEAAARLWRLRLLRVRFAMAMMQASRRDLKAAIAGYNDVASDLDTENARYNDAWSACFANDGERLHVRHAALTAVGKMLVECGNLDGAKKAFEAIEADIPTATTGLNPVVMNRGIYALACHDWDSAISSFTAVNDQAMANPDVDLPSVVAANNLALTHLYNGDIDSAILVLERAIHSGQKRNVPVEQGLLNNLFSLYELAWGTHATERKRKALVSIAHRLADGLNPQPLKMQPQAQGAAPAGPQSTTAPPPTASSSQRQQQPASSASMSTAQQVRAPTPTSYGVPRRAAAPQAARNSSSGAPKQQVSYAPPPTSSSASAQMPPPLQPGPAQQQMPLPPAGGSYGPPSMGPPPRQAPHGGATRTSPGTTRRPPPLTDPFGVAPAVAAQQQPQPPRGSIQQVPGQQQQPSQNSSMPMAPPPTAHGNR